MKPQKTAKLPLFYTQVIGSLPRPKFLLDLLERRDKVTSERFDSLLDELVLFAIRLQEEAGLDVVSDGEWRRTHYVGEFLKRIGGVEGWRKIEQQGEAKNNDVGVRRMRP